MHDMYMYMQVGQDRASAGPEQGQDLARTGPVLG